MCDVLMYDMCAWVLHAIHAIPSTMILMISSLVVAVVAATRNLKISIIRNSYADVSTRILRMLLPSFLTRRRKIKRREDEDTRRGEEKTR